MRSQRFCSGTVGAPRRVQKSSTWVKSIRRVGFIRLCCKTCICQPRWRHYGSIKDLFGEICNAFLTHFNLSDSGAALLTGFAITTWFAESLPIAPCISVATSTPTQAVLLMRFFACFCYHPLLLGSLSTNGFLSLPMQLTPTLIIHESGLSKKASTLLNASNYRGLPVHKSERLLDLYCAKAIVGQHHATFLENAIQVTIDPPRPLQISSFDERAEAELVKQFQSRLLMYRLENRERVVSSCFDIPDFISPLAKSPVTWASAYWTMSCSKKYTRCCATKTTSCGEPDR